MQNDNGRIKELMVRAKLGTASEAEREELERWAGACEANARVMERIMSGDSVKELLTRSRRIDGRTDYAALAAAIAGSTAIPARKKTHRTALWLSGAAVCAACVVLAVSVWRPQENNAEEIVAAMTAEGTGAALILDSGGKISLGTDASPETIRQYANATVDEEGGLVYDEDVSPSPAQPSETHRIVTDTGTDYSIRLGDGTRIRLNAETTLEYPSHFTGGERRVKLSGEAFFDVAPDAARPFIVETAGVNIEVLGTSFNVNAYPSRNGICTSVESGRVAVSLATNPDERVVLEPGMQAGWEKGAHGLTSRTVNVANAAMWRSGYYLFEEEDIQSVLGVLSRWYGVKFIYEHRTPGTYTFSGKIHKGQKLGDIFRMFTLAGGPEFKIVDERTVKVIK